MWYSLYSVGDIEIDEQHLNIDYMLTRLAREGSGDWVALSSIIEHLERHFSFEEDVAAGRGYLMTESHRARHRQLAAELGRFVQIVEEDPGQLHNTISLIQEVLVEHIREFDRYLIPDR